MYTPGADTPHPHSRQTATTADSTHRTGMHSCYRPQRSWAKVMFLQASVILSTGGGGSLPQCMLGCQTPPGPGTPRTRHPPPEADARIRSMSGRYASYWNAFLFLYNFAQQFPMYAGVFALQRFSQQYVGIRRAPIGQDSCWMSTSPSSSTSRKCEFKKHNLNCQEVLYPEGTSLLYLF